MQFVHNVGGPCVSCLALFSDGSTDVSAGKHEARLSCARAAFVRHVGHEIVVVVVAAVQVAEFAMSASMHSSQRVCRQGSMRGDRSVPRHTAQRMLMSLSKGRFISFTSAAVRYVEINCKSKHK